MSNSTINMRWDPYVLITRPEFDKFWESHLNERKRDVLFIVGKGFDTRAESCSKQICKIDAGGRRDAWLLNFVNGMPESNNNDELIASNYKCYRRIFGSKNIKELPIKLPGSGNRTSASRPTSKIINMHKEQFEKYDDIVIDVSAMPRMVAMTVIVKVLFLLDKTFKNGGKDVNLHILTSENVRSDRGVVSSSLSSTVTNVIGFSGRLNGEVTEHIPRVWFPILGENQEERLTRIREELRPDEIYPVIPFPSKDARRGDRIIAEYRQFLFDDFRVDTKNILYACEFNPFEAYKQIYSVIKRYRDSLNELGGCKVYISPLSSKLLSVGAVLACYNHRRTKDDTTKENEKLVVGIPFIEAASYGKPTQSTDEGGELYSMWIRGEWER